MPLYVYGCPRSKRHPRREVSHKMSESPVIQCEACGTVMQRVPQTFRFHVSPLQVLIDWSDENWRQLKKRKMGLKAPRFSPNEVNSPIPLKGKDFEHRRAKPNDSKTTPTS